MQLEDEMNFYGVLAIIRKCAK